MTDRIHPTAIVDPKAALEEDVHVGPYSVIGPGAFIGAQTEIRNHVTITGNVRIGKNNQIHPNCVIGAEPQDTSYRGSETWVVIGDRNIIREGVTIHRATEKEFGITRIGSDNLIMAGCHLAHDVIFGSHITLANTTLLSGHVHVHDHAMFSGLIGVLPFATIGGYSFVGGMSRISTDVPPYMLVDGNPPVVRYVNVVGLKRHGFDSRQIQSLTEAHRLIYREKIGAAQARQILQSHDNLSEPVGNLLEFLDRQKKGRHGRARQGQRAA